MVLYYIDDEPDTLMSFKPIYNEDPDVVQSEFLLFDFELSFTRAPKTDSDGEEEDYSNLETKTVSTTYRFQKDRLIREEDKDYIQAVVYHILDWIEVPTYRDIVRYLTDEIWDLKKRDAISKVERMEITLDVVAYRFPGEIVELDDADVELAVAPASDEAVETHLETVVKTEGYCVICMDEIRVGSDVAVGRLPCKHEFHRTCGEEWLRNSGVCPQCRSVFPSS